MKGSGLREQWDKRIGNPETEEEFLESRSPAFNADKIKSSLLISAGARDARVPLAESDQMVAALRKANKKVEYLVFPDEGHDLARPDNQFRYYAFMEQFLAQHLGGRLEPPREDETITQFKR